MMDSNATSTLLFDSGEYAGNVSTPNVSNSAMIAESLVLTRFVVQRILVPIVTSIGFVGNLISIRVLTHSSMVSSTNCYLTALSVFDLLYLVFSFTLSLNHYDAIKVQDVYQYWFYYGKTLTDICSNVSVCLTVTFSLERLVAVCYPMKGRIICTPQRARMITTVVVLFAIACTTPEFFEMRLVEVIENNKSRYKFVDTEMYSTDLYQIGYYNFIVLTFTVLPLVLLSSFNGILVKAVISATRIRKKMTYTPMKQDKNRRQKEQTRITIMLIVVVVVFLICQTPNAALMLYNIYLSSVSTTLTPDGRNNLRIAGNIVNILVLINSSINFILYSAMSTKFRRVCLNLVCNFGKSRKDIMTKTEASSLFNGHIPLHFRSRRYSNHEHRNYRDYNILQQRRNVRVTEYIFKPRNESIRDGHVGINNSNFRLDVQGNKFTPIGVRRYQKCRQNGLQLGLRYLRPPGSPLNVNKLECDEDASSDAKTEVSTTAELTEINLLLRTETSILNNEKLGDTVL